MHRFFKRENIQLLGSDTVTGTANQKFKYVYFNLVDIYSNISAKKYKEKYSQYEIQNQCVFMIFLVLRNFDKFVCTLKFWLKS